MSYLILHVKICSFLNQQLGSSRVTSLTRSYQWCHSTLENEHTKYFKLSVHDQSHCDVSIPLTVYTTVRATLASSFKNLMPYQIMLVQVCSFLYQQLGSFRVTSFTGSYQWCHSPCYLDIMPTSTISPPPRLINFQ